MVLLILSVHIPFQLRTSWYLLMDKIVFQLCTNYYCYALLLLTILVFRKKASFLQQNYFLEEYGRRDNL